LKFLLGCWVTCRWLLSLKIYIQSIIQDQHLIYRYPVNVFYMKSARKHSFKKWKHNPVVIYWVTCLTSVIFHSILRDRVVICITMLQSCQQMIISAWIACHWSPNYNLYGFHLKIPRQPYLSFISTNFSCPII